MRDYSLAETAKKHRNPSSERWFVGPRAKAAT